MISIVIIGSIFFFAFLVLYLDHLSDSRQMDRNKLKGMNELFHCSGCHRYSRRYYIELKELCDQDYTEKKKEFLSGSKVAFYYRDSFCPHCEDHMATTSNAKEGWIGKHPDAPLLKKKDIKSIENTKELASIISYESTVKSIDRSLELDVLFEDLLLGISIKRNKK